MPEMLRDKELLAGLLFVIVGGAFAAGALEHSIGTARRMGPGYFPLMVGGLLTAVGITIAVRSLLARRADVVARLYLRPAAGLTLSIVAFALLIDRAGLVIACIATVLIAGTASPETRWREAVLIAAVMAVFSALVFKFLLGLPFRLWV